MLTPGNKKKVADFEIFHRYYMDENSNVECELPDFAKDPENLIKMYKMMVLTRAFDSKAINLQRTGKMGTYPSNLGQEAIGVFFGRTAAVRLPHGLAAPDVHGASLPGRGL